MRLPSAHSLLAAAETGQASDLLARLRTSRTFNSPDCVDAMAETLRLVALVEGLQVCHPFCKPSWGLCTCAGVAQPAATSC